MVQGPITSILVTIRITVRIQESEVRYPDSLHYRITNGFWWYFMESWGCGLQTNLLHFGDDPHHYPDPGRTATVLLCWRSVEVCALWVLQDDGWRPSYDGAVARNPCVSWAFLSYSRTSLHPFLTCFPNSHLHHSPKIILKYIPYLLNSQIRSQNLLSHAALTDSKFHPAILKSLHWRTLLTNYLI